MKFVFTPEEAQEVALNVAKYLRREAMEVKAEVAVLPDAPCRTTLLAVRSGLSILIEAQGSLNYTNAMRDLARWLAAGRKYAEFYLAVTSEATMKTGVLAELKKDGVGLFVVSDGGTVSKQITARNPALMITPDPTLKFGRCKDEVLGAVEKFNAVNRKDGLRDMCELVERETERLAISAVKGGRLKKTEAEVKRMDWATIINALAAKENYSTKHHPVVSASLKDDLHSFRGARNLVDHKARSKREDQKRQRQFAERMIQGPRLITEIVALQRKLGG